MTTWQGWTYAVIFFINPCDMLCDWQPDLHKLGLFIIFSYIILQIITGFPKLQIPVELRVYLCYTGKIAFDPEKTH